MWNKFLDKMLRLLLSIPRSWRVFFRTLIVMGVLIFYLVHGIKFVIEFFNGTSSSIKPSDIVISLALAFILFWFFKKDNKNK